MQGDIQRILVAQAATGDDAAFARIVATYHDDMARISHPSTWSEA